ncbi:hypothetical protein EJ06DRAFT_480803 [Trichodelitschia bisporula]|uniref:Cupredoxin n=1 Tax=Trichodelitschia bisporula TaxID=703511 RepID=A0A6G1HQP2_9PEZI|nr:hypothetical protein EJ06DRAFT_480803 [Trichodelitschia bisporula]
MRTSLLALALGSAALLANGQTTTSTLGATTTSTSSAAATFTVTVGRGDHRFVPDVVQAPVGSYVKFNFYPANHSVVRAEYLTPCVPYELMGKGNIGFFSGFHPVDAILDDPPSWTIRINDSSPLFYYCSAPDACIKYQMVAVINPNATVSLKEHKDAAAKAQFALNPGEPFPAEGTLPASASTASKTDTATPSSSTQPTAAAASDSDHHKSFPAGAIAGVVVGVVLIIILAAALFFFIGRARSRRSLSESKGIPPQPPMSPAPQAPAEGIVGPNGTLYVPVKMADMHRMSLPPYAGHAPPQGQEYMPGMHSPRFDSPPPQGQAHGGFGYGPQGQQQQQQQHRFVY